MTAITRTESEVLYAMGYRMEPAPLCTDDRAVLHLPGVYITLSPAGQDTLDWSVWTEQHGRFLYGGNSTGAVAATHDAAKWIQEQWL